MSHHRAVPRRRRVTAAGLRAVAAVLVTLAGVLSSMPFAAAATADVRGSSTAASPVDLRLTGVDAVVQQAGDEVVVTAEIRHDGPEDVRNVTVQLAAHEALANRGSLQRALDAPDAAPERLGRVVGTVVRSAPDLPASGPRFVAVRTTVQELGLDAGSATVRPLSLSVRGDAAGPSTSDELAMAATAMVIAPAEAQGPVATSVLVRLLGVDPATRNGDEDVEWVAPVARALIDAGAPVAVAADPLLARTIAGGAVTELLDGGDADRVAVPFASADLDALLRADLTGRARSHVALGLSPWPADPELPTTPGAIRPLPEVVVAPAAALRASTVGRLLQGRTPAIVVPSEGARVDPDGEPVTSPGPLRPLDDVAGLRALIGDPWLSRTLAERPELDAADVQRVVAETALLWLERPGSPDQRGLLLDPGDAWRPSPDGLAALLRALDDAPWLELTGAAALLDVEASPSASLVVPSDGPPALSAAYLAALDDAWALVDAAAGILTDPGTDAADRPSPPPGAGGGQVVADGATAALRLDLLRAASVAFRGDEQAGRTLISRAQEAAADLIAGVEVLSQPTVTLTDETGRLPVVLRNEAASALRVRVALDSRRLTFPTMAREVTLAPQTTTTVVFEARARTPGGTSPVDVTVTDPSGERELARGAMVVRIASYPVSALVVLAVVAVVLLGTWLRGRLGRRRTDRPPVAGGTDVDERAPSPAEPR